MKKLIITLLCVLFFTCTSSAAEIEGMLKDPPDGFRDMKWGDSASKLGGSAKLHEEDNFVKIYIRKDDKLSIGAAVLEIIGYTFCDDKLVSVIFTAKNKSNCIDLKEAMIARYGKPAQKNRYTEYYTWIDPSTVFITYDYSPADDAAKVHISSVSGLLEYEKKRKERAEKAAEDF